MSKYQPLWEYVAQANAFPLKLTFDEIRSVLGFAVDHSFLAYKKETENFGFVVKKISLKDSFVLFDKR